LYLGGVFLYAAWGKVVEPYDFAVSIATYQMLPLQLINLMAIVLPWLELIAGALLILGLFTRAQAVLINAMLIVFIVAIASALHRGLALGTCGCFASEEAAEELSSATVWRDVGWLVIGIAICFVKEEARWGVENYVRWTRRKE
jgi:uncharacterized membrane protein YphA (DoxX/SURF4 family)